MVADSGAGHQLSVQPENHILKYLDEDGDLVTLTDDADIQSVYQTSKVLKVMVYDRERLPPPASMPFQGQQHAKQHELAELCQRLDLLLKTLPSQNYTGHAQSTNNPSAYPPRPTSNDSQHAGAALASNPSQPTSPGMATHTPTGSTTNSTNNSHNHNSNPPYEAASSVYPPPPPATGASGSSGAAPYPPNNANAVYPPNTAAMATSGGNVATSIAATAAGTSAAVMANITAASPSVYPPVNGGSVYPPPQKVTSTPGAYPPPPPIGQVPAGNVGGNATGSNYASPALPAGYAPPPGTTSAYPPPPQQAHPDGSGQNTAYPPTPAYY
ncbi:hypothetical protein SYNPS1DRAFT_30268 [Syncephalis pseudoplumigaleata]|uniref:PB1 domain-containing protein n=1 Tax=Syncephalis pseudoplumigaleata TaxID=1712513 RepID=A0A4P9YVC0_9FUNG|nr:hypothetical protein SYNPS1DRAFT_30268 [Syncephalis pseudoplumigaleata]|eukprot:RKP23957.1 hypothetical protein SYNPS1DRAFT_30268 [Syncephalis pseudoplumigaleata]